MFYSKYGSILEHRDIQCRKILRPWNHGQCHWKWYHSIHWIWFPISVL